MSHETTLYYLRQQLTWDQLSPELQAHLTRQGYAEVWSDDGWWAEVVEPRLAR